MLAINAIDLSQEKQTKVSGTGCSGIEQPPLTMKTSSGRNGHEVCVSRNEKLTLSLLGEWVTASRLIADCVSLQTERR